MPSDQKIQNRVLADFYEDEGGGFLLKHHLWRRSIGEYDEEWDDVDRDEIEYALTTAGEDGLLDADHDTAQIGVRGLKQLHNSGYETNLDEKVQEFILETLLAHKRENPSSLGMSRDDLVDKVGEDREVVDENVWYLDRSFYLDADTRMAATAYGRVEITSAGRKAIQR